MNKKSFIYIALLISFAAMVGCASLDTARHENFMKGQILEASDDEVYLCIGTQDGAEVGQELGVYRYVKVRKEASGESGLDDFEKMRTGEVRITELVDHYAKAKILTGVAKVNYMVELEK